MDNKTSKRSRGANFQKEEKEMIVNFVTENSSILESKSSEPNIYKKKKHLWQQLSEKMEASGFKRNPIQLRDTYYRFKTQAKRKVTNYRQLKKKTGGGSGPTDDDMPSEMDWAICDACPTDFEEDDSMFDSDFIETSRNSQFLSKDENAGSTVHYIDPKTGDLHPASSPTYTIIEENNLELPSREDSPEPLTTTTVNSHQTKSNTIKKRKRDMSSYEEEMLKLHTKHIQERINNEKCLKEKELELFELKKQKTLLKIELFQKKLKKL